MVRNFNLVKVEDTNLVKASYPNYKGAEFILAETGYVHLGFFTRSVKIATAQKVLYMDIGSKETFIELTAEQVKPLLSGNITAQGFAEVVSKILGGEIKKSQQTPDQTNNTPTDPPTTGDENQAKLKDLEDSVAEKQEALDKLAGELEQDPENEELKKDKQSAQGKLNYANTQLKKFKEENRL